MSQPRLGWEGLPRYRAMELWQEVAGGLSIQNVGVPSGGPNEKVFRASDVIPRIKALQEEVERLTRQQARLQKALEEVAHHADDEAGFMVMVRAALAPEETSK